MLHLLNRHVLLGVTLLLGFNFAGVCICQENQSDALVTNSWATSASVFNKRFRFEVQGSKLKTAPLWKDPEISEPPLSRAKAVQISRSQLSQYYPEVKSWSLSEISLFSLEKGYWFWVIEWVHERKKLGDGLSIPVLMSGEAIVGTLDKDKNEE